MISLISIAIRSMTYVLIGKIKKEYYEFKEGAWYQMISEWPIKDKSGRGISKCTMVMNVSSDGIAEIAKFIGHGSNDENYILSLEQDQAYCMELIKQNKELYIQNVLLYNAVEEFLRMQHRGSDSLLPGAIPQNKDNIGSNPTDSSGISEVCGEQLKPSHGDNVGGTPTSSGESRVPTEVNLKGKETQTETDLQIQSDHKLCKELDEMRKEISGLVQSFESIKSDEGKSKYTVALRNEVTKLKKASQECDGQVNRIKSQVKKL